MSESNKTGFSGIFNSLRKIIFVDDPQPEETVTADAKMEPATVSRELPPAINELVSKPPIIDRAVPTELGRGSSEEMVNKIYALLETLNKPGIDFFEFWNAASAMGGTTAGNLQNAYKALNVLGLTRETILNSGAAYKQELNQRLSEEIKRKAAEKISLETRLQTERKQLEQQNKDTEEKIRELNAFLATNQATLAQLDEKYRPQLQAITQRIESGGQALKTVLDEMQAVLDTVASSVH